MTKRYTLRCHECYKEINISIDGIKSKPICQQCKMYIDECEHIVDMCKTQDINDDTSKIDLVIYYTSLLKIRSLSHNILNIENRKYFEKILEIVSGDNTHKHDYTKLKYDIYKKCKEIVDVGERRREDAYQRERKLYYYSTPITKQPPSLIEMKCLTVINLIVEPEEYLKYATITGTEPEPVVIEPEPEPELEPELDPKAMSDEELVEYYNNLPDVVS